MKTTEQLTCIKHICYFKYCSKVLYMCSKVLLKVHTIDYSAHSLYKWVNWKRLWKSLGWNRVVAQVDSPGVHSLHHCRVPTNVDCAYHCAIFCVPSLSFYWNRYVTCPLSKAIVMIDKMSAKSLQKQLIILKMMISFPRLVLEHLKSEHLKT